MDLVQVGVADAAVRDLNLDVVLAHRPPREAEGRQVACGGTRARQRASAGNAVPKILCGDNTTSILSLAFLF